MADIRAGIGGWNFAPWRKTFYPAGTKAAEELHYASRHVTAIEINATFYRTQSVDTYRRWAAETPDDFVFALKAHRVTTQRKVLAESGPSIVQFLEKGPLELGAKLGPIVWQFAPFKKFEPDDFEAFLAALPAEIGGRKLRHVAEVRHRSFCDPAFVALARQYGVAICLADSDDYPLIADPTADFIYARLQKTEADEETGYSGAALATWAARAAAWSAGKLPADLPVIADAMSKSQPRDCFMFFIAGAKERNPAAAQAFIRLIGSPA